MRSLTGVRRHSPASKQARAAATAASASRSVGAGTDPITRSVNGEMTSIRAVDSAATQRPPR
jgi:hypothetical protein